MEGKEEEKDVANKQETIKTTVASDRVVEEAMKKGMKKYDKTLKRLSKS
ncbi:MULTISPECIES: hypothetical protein [Paenibacillus]|nr:MULTISPECIES: hypothetical protein [Paenibacillus]ACT03288.1 hypothetical protein Pjdr2_4674 [Paenibacillus sp. JDR-2]